MSAPKRPTAPRRGTRPANRRELILVAARQLFFQQGYDHVSVSDIADAVAIGPSALYRHFDSKQQLLAEVLRREHTLMVAAMAELEGADTGVLPRAIEGLARLALDFRGGSVLIQREARHLPEPDRAAVRDGSRQIGRRTAALVRRLRPDLDDAAADLIGWAVIGVVSSPSLHRLELPRQEFESLLGDLVMTVVGHPVPAGFALSSRNDVQPSSQRPYSKREHLMAEAARLFAMRGYANIAVEDVGAALGIAGPSVYNHFPAKLDLLQTPMTRGIGHLMLNLGAAFDGAASPEEVLGRLIRSHVAFSLDHPDLLELLFSEVTHLPEAIRMQFRQAQLEYLQEWGELFRAINPSVSVVGSRIRVQAAVAMVGDVVRIRHLRWAKYVDAALVGICDRLLLPQPEA